MTTLICQQFLIIQAVFLSTTLALDCFRKSKTRECRGLGGFNDIVELCDLSHQICHYNYTSTETFNKDLNNDIMPTCLERVVDPVVCEETVDVECSCEFNDDGYPSCGCVDNAQLKESNVYVWLGVSVCVGLIVLCLAVFLFKYAKRRRRARGVPVPSAPLEEEGDVAPPSYDVAVALKN